MRFSLLLYLLHSSFRLVSAALAVERDLLPCHRLSVVVVPHLPRNAAWTGFDCDFRNALVSTSGRLQRQVDFNVCVSLDFMMTELDALLTHCRLSTIASLHLVAHADKNTDWDDPCLFVGGANQHQFIFTTAVKRPE
jgi:hypothetical protein